MQHHHTQRALPPADCVGRSLCLRLCRAQCLCIVLLVLRVDDFGAVVGCGMFLVTLCGYLITQLRLHTLTFTVSSSARRTVRW